MGEGNGWLRLFGLVQDDSFVFGLFLGVVLFDMSGSQRHEAAVALAKGNWELSGGGKACAYSSHRVSPR